MRHNHHQGTNTTSPTNPQPPQNKPTATNHKSDPQITNRTHADTTHHQQNDPPPPPSPP